MPDRRKQALERARTRSLSQMTQQFTNDWFPGGDAYDPADRPWVSVHDAGHVYANTAPLSPGDKQGELARGERQQWLFDAAGTRELNNNYGAMGFVNEFHGRLPPSPQEAEGVISQIRNHDYGSSDAVKSVGLRRKWNEYRTKRGLTTPTNLEDPEIQPLTAQDWGKKSLEEINSSRNLYVPPIGNKEASELKRRGKEYYGQIAEESRRLFGEPGQEGGLLRDIKADKLIPGVADGTMVPVNSAALRIHSNPDRIQISGGYDAPGALPYGSLMQFVEKPKHPAIDMGLYRDKASRAIESEVNASRSSWQVPQGLTGKEKHRARNSAENAMLAFGNRVSDAYGAPDTAPTLASTEFKSRRGDPAESYLTGDLKHWRQENAIGDKDTILRLPRSPEASEIGATLREVERVKGAVGRGVRAGQTAFSNLPLLDPEFHEAIDRRDGARAAAVTVKNLTIGAGAEAATGAGAGVLQRVAPRVAAQVLPVLGIAASAANAVGLATLAPGSSPVPNLVGRYRGAPVYYRGQEDSYVAEVGGKGVRLGRAKLGGKDVFVPWGSTAGTEVGPKTVGRPWWDGGAERAVTGLQRQAAGVAGRAAAAATSGYRGASKAVNRALSMENVPTAGNEAKYIFRQLSRGQLPYQR